MFNNKTFIVGAALISSAFMGYLLGTFAKWLIEDIDAREEEERQLRIKYLFPSEGREGNGDVSPNPLV